MDFRLGLIPDTWDERDLVYEAVFPRVLPPAVDLRPRCTPVRNQGQLGACTGFALTAAREFWEPEPQAILSPLYVYYHERRLEGTIRRDAGAMLRDGCKVLVKQGVCPEEAWPYDTSVFRTAPSVKAEKIAGMYKVAGYHRVHSVSGLKAALADGFPAAIGAMLYASFGSTQAGHVQMPVPHEQLLGGHAMCCVGYEDAEGEPGGGHIIVKNSWGEDFGDRGYVYIPYAYVEPKLMPDIWVITM